MVAELYFHDEAGNPSTIWRHMGWGQSAASGNVVSLDYAACGTNVVCSGATDHGDVYYIRSTDAGVTWGTPGCRAR